jgi:hypothetical protein
MIVDRFTQISLKKKRIKKRGKRGYFELIFEMVKEMVDFAFSDIIIGIGLEYHTEREYER